ncbi:hypothetical protein CO044_03040, partial [Candidatus Peregrinibacteria bacterium CG_4_9_14_0_2_um_filter_38_9]
MAEAQSSAEDRVSGMKITDTVLQNIGLQDLTPKNVEARLAEQEGRKPRRISKEVRARLLAESKTAVVDFFTNSTEPLNTAPEPADEIPERPQIHSRLLRVTKGPKAGLVVGTQSEGPKKTLFVTDIASAGRRIDHIDDGHKKEIEQLKKIEAKLAEMTAKLYKGDLEAIRSSGELESMQAEIVGIVESLKFTRNDQKREILKRVSRCVTFADSKGRFNPPSKLAIWNTTQSFIAKRIRNIGGISDYLKEDRGAIDSCM